MSFHLIESIRGGNTASITFAHRGLRGFRTFRVLVERSLDASRSPHRVSLSMTVPQQRTVLSVHLGSPPPLRRESASSVTELGAPHLLLQALLDASAMHLREKQRPDFADLVSRAGRAVGADRTRLERLRRRKPRPPA